MFHRHPVLSLVTFVYLGFVAWLTLTPDLAERDEWGPVLRVALANVALFVPAGLFFPLLVGTRFWWVALAGPARTPRREHHP